ncbi:MAG: hypothetical protein KTV77_00940 [Wolbachia endosymbiont of Fragariocoptes setiger]|nr:hypothetical protein [Wolbachia endosymbiont of Fragariocoptes setiger]
MLKNNDIQEMFCTIVSLLAITHEEKELDKLIKYAIGCIKILKDAGEINSFITINDNYRDKENPLDIILMFNFHNERSINNTQLLKLAEYI